MDTKVLKAIAHHLDPIVTIGNAGLSTSVIAELKRAISDHELIKIRL
ncbi:MAG: YhbY family RNA-binding protein, partial [Pseudomonadota bacterium]|nr:YhbY family RNA-binding protein [Pseudomonadota bacterium]